MSHGAGRALGAAGAAERGGHLGPGARPPAPWAGSLIAGLLAATAWIAFPGGATAQASCGVQDNAYICSLPAGSYDTPQEVDQPASSVASVQGIGVTSLGDIGLTSSTPAIDALLYGLGVTANGANSPTGDIYGVTVDNQGSIAFQPDTTTSLSTFVFGIYAYNAASGTGTAEAGVNVTNSAAIDIDLLSVTSPAGAGIWAGDRGGGSGGASTGAWVDNSGAITVALSGSAGFAGIQASSWGGGNSNGGHGGAAGESSVTNSAPVGVTWNWQGAGRDNNGIYGLQAQSVGGEGGSNDDGSGGTGGGAGSATATLNAGGDVSVTVSGTPPSGSANSAGVLAAVIGGNGGTGGSGEGYNGGFGAGIAGAAQIQVTDANVTTSGDFLPGLLGIMQAGSGASTGCQLGAACTDSQSYDHQSGGYGGQVVGAGYITVTASTEPVTISTTGQQSAAVQMMLTGGAGGNAGSDTTDFGGTAGSGGGGGAVTGTASVTLTGNGADTVALSTQGDSSPGVYVVSQGGNGGLGGQASTEFFDITAGSGGAGGAAGNLSVSLASAAVATQGASSPGIYALSQGGGGAAGADAQGGLGETYGGGGGAGGDAGAVMVTLDGASSIRTAGADAAGILAQSFSGTGGNAGGANGGGTHGTGGGTGGAAGTVTVTNGGAIGTGGDTARGILAQSMAGAGGGGGFASGITAHGGTGGSAGATGAVSVTHDGSISTMGSNAQAVLLQSIGGSGGAGGQAGGNFSSVGGSADDTPFTADGNIVTFTSNGGLIGTGGMAAFGVLGQSIGGGGGDGGGSSGGNVVVGGNGGAGGAGGTVQAQFASGSQIVTAGDAAAGIVMQSIGGGGGNAGNANGDALFVSAGVGGAGGGGGTGGPVTVAADGTQVVTLGSKAPGLLAQSIGGGGGTGGWAFVYSVGPGASVSSGIGGAGGGGGDAGTASATLSGTSITTGFAIPLLAAGVAVDGVACTQLPCNMLPVDSFGAVVQSIGGGGGTGGPASAQSLAIAVPVDTDGDQVGVAYSLSVGGKGGTAGTGGLAEFFLTEGSSLTTYGQGSTGVMAQSIGGGGGNGGDSSALAAVVGYDAPGDTTLAITQTVTVGGDGGGGGDGGEVLVALGGTLDTSGNFTGDAAGSAPTSITTFGDYANGVTAQSIGGGGGNAGIGAGNTQSFGTSSSTSVSVTLGSLGGTGGTGGQVYAFVGPGEGITTYGSGALGLLAQSVGGGGGTSQGGSFSVAQSFTLPAGPGVRPGGTVNLGATPNGTGGAGGDVNVDVAAPITTHGGDAVGVLAQSIGGGGGLGGSSGSDASADNPIVPNNGLAYREGTSEIAQFLQNFFEGGDNSIPSIDPTLTLSIGGAGAQGGTAGNAEVALSAAITTYGDWATGVIVQSVGGGGGKGGTAAASGTGGIPEVTINANQAIGGNGGGGGNGSEAYVLLQQGAAIRTAGYGAAGIVAQSVGGGGGMGADGSDAAAGLISLGKTLGGSGGGAGDGGPVTLNYQTTAGAVIATTGDAADGIVLQSVGGGGGMGGAGSSLFLPTFLMQDTSLQLSVGGAQAASGNGGTVTLQQTADNALAIATQGAYSIGILAQSIGGGGGLATAQPSVGTVTAELGGNFSSGTGGMVDVTATGVTITTQGIAAHGILAQSIGGGGGYIRVADTTGASDTSALTTAAPTNGSLYQGTGGGGAVNVYVGGGGSVDVSGGGAVGILAQSIGGGGGVMVNDNSIFAGSSAAILNDCPACTGGGGTVDVWVSGNVSATGANGIGIFAQSAGTGSNGTISISPVNATVTGGSGTAATPSQPGASGIQLDGGSSSNVVELSATGAVTTGLGTGGTAILQTGGGVTTVTNAGTVTGAVYLNGGSFNNVDGGTHNTGSVNDGDVVNHGMLNVGFTDEVRSTHVTGDFTQSDRGRLGVTIHSIGRTADLLDIAGTASIDGLIVPTAITLLPGTVPVVKAGQLTFTAEAQDSLLFQWEASQAGHTLYLTPQANFTPAGVSLNASQSSLADYFTRAWDNADAGLATDFARLSQVTGASGYTAVLNEYSGADIQAQSLALANAAGEILGASMSCPVFVDRNVLLVQDSCTWLQVIGRWTDQDTTRDIQGYYISGMTYRIGLQGEIAPDWYLGGSFALGQTNASMEGGSTGSGDTYDGSLSLKRTMGPWFFAGSLAMAYGDFESNRLVNLPGASGALESDPSLFLFGGRLRAGYEFAFDDWYMRPYGDLDIVYTHLPGVTETGSSPYALAVNGSSETNVALALMMEVGGRVGLKDGSTLRPYAAFGVSYLPDNTRAVTASLVNASAADGTFTDYLESPEFLGRFDLGLQLFHAAGLELRAGYTADIGDSYLSPSASARLVHHF